MGKGGWSKLDNTYGLDWSTFRGTQACLKWNHRDLGQLLHALTLTKGRTAVIQAGGNLGIFAKVLAREFETVYTFEPDPKNFLHLCHNAPETNIVRFQVALGRTHELVGLCRDRPDGMLHKNHEGIVHVKGAGTVPTMLIDDLELPVCDLVYLDLEGYEHAALAGARDTLRRCRPVVVVEINKSLDRMGLSPDDLHTQLRMHGYQFVNKIQSDEFFIPHEVVA